MSWGELRRSSVLVLNWVIRYTEATAGQQMNIEANVRHVEVSIADVSFEKNNNVSTPAVKITVGQAEHELALALLSPDQVALFHSVLMCLS